MECDNSEGRVGRTEQGGKRAAQGCVPHEHGEWIADALTGAEDLWAQREVNLTPGRGGVVEIRLQQHKGMGA